MNAYKALGFVCNGDESALTSCTLTGSECAAGRTDHAIAIECESIVTEPGPGIIYPGVKYN